jgi:hypothetical protein
LDFFVKLHLSFEELYPLLTSSLEVMVLNNFGSSLRFV